MMTGRRHRSHNLRRRPVLPPPPSHPGGACRDYRWRRPPSRHHRSHGRQRSPRSAADLPLTTTVFPLVKPSSSPPRRPRPPRRRRGSLYVYPQIRHLIMRSGRALVLAWSGPAGPALGAGEAGARPRSCRPTPRVSDAWPVRTAGTDGAPGTSRRPPWPGRYPRWPARERRLGRKAPDRPPGTRPTATSHAAPPAARPVGWVAEKP
jgi:hypothetical protein